MVLLLRIWLESLRVSTSAADRSDPIVSGSSIRRSHGVTIITSRISWRIIWLAQRGRSVILTRGVSIRMAPVYTSRVQVLARTTTLVGTVRLRIIIRTTMVRRYGSSIDDWRTRSRVLQEWRLGFRGSRWRIRGRNRLAGRSRRRSTIG
jgi:hypothetical protein